MNKIITCTWILKAKGLNTDQIVQQLMDGLAQSDGILPGDAEDFQQALNRALHADSLDDCFFVVEEADLRRKLVFSPGIGGWDRMVLAIKIDGSGNYWSSWHYSPRDTSISGSVRSSM